MMSFTRSRHVQPAMPDPIQIVMLMGSARARPHAPLDVPPPAFLFQPRSFVPQFTERTPFELTTATPYPFGADVIDGEIAEPDAPPQSRGARRSVTDRERGRAGLRCLLPRPGVKRTVCFGEFKRQLSRQLAHPERLRESHRLPCCVQLYRVTIAQPRTAVARRVLGVGAAAEDLLAHTPETAQRLHLPPPRTAHAQSDHASRESPWLAAGDEVVELRVIHDHTQDVRREGSDVASDDVREDVRDSRTAPAADVTPQHSATPSAPSTKSGIPARFLISPDFRLTREEALFDSVVATASARGVFGSLRCRVLALLNRGELRRWRALLDGEARDEQLWKVRPPKVALTDPRSRTWVHRTLTLGGYDAEHMLREWELYWRRKGV